MIRRAAASTVVGILAFALVGAGVCVGLIGVACYAVALDLSPGSALVLTALGAIAGGGLLMALSVQGLMCGLKSLRSTREELARTLALIKAVVAHGVRPAARRERL